MALVAPPGFILPLRNISWRIREPAQRNRSAWTGTSKKIGLPGAAHWSATGQFPPIVSEVEALPWRAFFLSLHGLMNSFPVQATEGLQTTAANGQVSSSGRTDGNTLPIEGLPANSTVLVAGRMISVALPSGHQRLAGLTADLVTNGAGQAVAALSLELGEVPYAGAYVEIRRPWSRMSLTEPETGWDVDLIQYGFSIDAEEDR